MNVHTSSSLCICYRRCIGHRIMVQQRIQRVSNTDNSEQISDGITSSLLGSHGWLWWLVVISHPHPWLLRSCSRPFWYHGIRLFLSKRRTRISESLWNRNQQWREPWGLYVYVKLNQIYHKPIFQQDNKSDNWTIVWARRQRVDEEVVGGCEVSSMLPFIYDIPKDNVCICEWFGNYYNTRHIIVGWWEQGSLIHACLLGYKLQNKQARRCSFLLNLQSGEIIQ
jgi:hypothetical protein